MDNLSLFANRVREEWNACHGAFYRVHENDLMCALKDQRWLHYREEVWAGTPVLLAEANSLGTREGILPSQTWVTLFGRVNEARAFVQDGLQKTLARGSKRLIFGGDEFHFVAGVPSEDSLLVEVLRSEGFAGPEAVDFAGSLNTPELIAYTDTNLTRASAEGWRLESVNAENSSLLQAFLREEFPGRWRREFDFSKLQGLPPIWFLLRDRQALVRGFSRLALRKNGAGVAGFRLPLHAGGLRDEADGAIGPLGLGKDLRGRGLGRVLLALSLERLREQGARAVVIDWASDPAFYLPLGLAEIRRAHCLRRSFL